MAKIAFQTIPVGLQNVYARALQFGDRFSSARVLVKRLLLSRDRVKGITQKSIMPAASIWWQNFTQGERDAWDAAGVKCNLTGWKFFLRDYGYRLKNGMSGVSTPSLYYQVEVGLLRLEAPASSLQIFQIHPLDYWTYKKVTGTRSQYEPVAVHEDFNLPVVLQCSHRTNLVSVGASPRARMWIDILSHYQGRDIHTIGALDFGLQDAWQITSVTVSSVVGLVRGYTMFCEVHDCTGDLFFDNVSVTHSGHNFARDPACNDIDQSFTKAFAQIPKHWASESVPDGAFFGSVYYNKIIE